MWFCFFALMPIEHQACPTSVTADHLSIREAHSYWYSCIHWKPRLNFREYVSIFQHNLNSLHWKWRITTDNNFDVSLFWEKDNPFTQKPIIKSESSQKYFYWKHILQMLLFLLTGTSTCVGPFAESESEEYLYFWLIFYLVWFKLYIIKPKNKGKKDWLRGGEIFS